MIPPSTIQKAAEAIEATGETTRQGAKAAAHAAFDAIGLAELLEAAKMVVRDAAPHAYDESLVNNGLIVRLSTAIAKIGAG